MAKQRLVKKGSQYGILDEASNTVLPISENMKLVQKQGQYGILDGDSVIPIDNFSESITDSDLDILKKKNSTESVGQPIPKPGSSVSPKIQGSGLAASPAKQSEIGLIDDIWNSFKGAGAKALASIAAVPQFAQNAAMDIVASATGRSSEFNKLPSAVKKQVRDAITGTLSKGATSVGQLAGASQEATDYLNKKSEDIYKKTRQEEIDVVDELSKFKDNPNAESIKKVLYQGLKTTFESAPYMAIGMASLPALAVTAAAGKREEDISKDGEIGIGNLLNAGIYGAAEAVFEGTTNKILRKAANSAVGNPKAAKAVAEGFVKSILKDFGQEAASEGATSAIQDLSDRITKGENIQDINYYKIAKNVANSAILGGISGGGISLTASTAGAARRYVASKIMPKKQSEKLDNNIKTIQSLNLEHGDDVDPRVNQIVNKKIDELVAENEAIIAENEAIAANLSPDQIKQVFEIDDKLEENYNSAKSIIDDVAMDDNAKKLLLDDLLKQQNNLKQEKDAVQKQATSEVSVQPEAGAGVQMAEGESQAEPQGVTEEVKVEEVTPEAPKAESIEDQMQSVFGLNKTQSKAASTVIDRIAGTMAGRAGTTKEEILKTISFEKGTPTEEVTIEKPVEQVKTKTPKTEGPIDTEVKFEDAIDNQVVSWNKFPEQKKGKEIASRNQVLTKAANDLLNGNISNEDYRAIVEKESPIKPIETFFNPSTGEEIQASLEAPKVPLVNSVTAKGETFVDPKTNQEFEIISDKVGLRLDLPAYLNNNKWVVTVHADAKDTNTGKVTKDKPVSYTGVAKIKDVTFDFNPNLAAKIAKGESSRETKFKMRGTMVPVEGATVDEQNANAKKEVESIQNDPSWVQIGANPFRHSYFYNRSTGKPVLSADEVIQIGGLVYAKNPVEANWNDEKFAVTQKGKPVLDKKGNQVYFQDNKATVSLANDGRFIVTALTDPNVSTPLHEMAHIYEHYLENKEKQKILSWAGKKDWDMSVSEKFARGFEKYLSQGKTPSAELNKIFENFKKWLLNIYNGIVGSDIDIELNKDMRKIYDIMLSGKGKQAKAPSVNKILGKPAPDKVTIGELKLYKDQIKIENKTSRDANKTRRDVIEKIKDFVTRGALSKAQQKSLLNSLAKTNILNPIMRERLFERMQKMFNRVDYQDRIKEATTFRNKIKKLAKSETLQASVANMSKDFSKVIPELTDVDKYLEKAREVYNAIKKPLRTAAVIDDINKFSETELKKQEEKLKNTLLDQYDYLVEDGLIDESMSLSEIQKYVMDVEKGLKPDTEANEAKIKNNLTELFDSMKESVDSILEDGYNPITSEEIELDDYTRKLLKNYSSMDVDKMSIAEAYRTTEALENYLVNGIVDNMESMYRVYEGALKNAKLAEQGVVAQNLKRFGILGRSDLYARSWAANISPLKSVIDLMFRSREMGAKFLKESGLRDIANSSSRAKTETQNIDKAYDEKFSKTKPNKQPFYSAENTYERGMYAHLRRTFEGTAAEVNSEFNRRKKQIVDTIDKLKKSGDDKLIARAKVYQKVFDKFKDAKNIQEVESAIDVINASAVKWWNAVFDKYYPEVKQIASSVYNTVLEDDINYSPDNYEKILEDSVPDVNEVSTYRMAFNFLNSEKSGTLMKNNRLQELPKNRAMNFDFDFNNSSALGKMLVDVRTAPYIQQYRGFSSAPSFDEIFKDPKDRDVIKEKMNWYVNEVRSKNYSTANVRAKDAEKIFREISRIGTGRALGSALSIFKQFSTAMINTSINLANNPKALGQGLASIRDKSAMKWLENSGYAIANRGLESQTAIESADRILNQTNPEAVNKLVGSTKKILDTVEKVNQFYLKSFLQNGDVFGARASWMAYYISKLDSMGVNTSNIDWSKHELVKEAADYAQDKVDLQQNVSDSAMLGKLLNSKNPYLNMAKSLFIPFSSFVFNAKDKISTDLTILSSNASDQEKLNAIKSLSGTAVEMMVFEVMGSSITLGIEMLASSLLGYDTDEDELRDKLDKGLQRSTTRMITDAFSPIPNWGDKIMVSLLNKALNLVQRDIDEEDRKLLYAYEAKGDFNNIMGLIGGIPEIALKPLVNFAFTLDKILSDTYVDDFGNEIELSDEDKEKLTGILAAQLAAPFLPTEYGRTLEKMEQKIEKEAR